MKRKVIGKFFDVSAAQALTGMAQGGSPSSHRSQEWAQRPLNRAQVNTIQCEVINSLRYQLGVKHGNKSRVTKRNKTAPCPREHSLDEQEVRQ